MINTPYPVLEKKQCLMPVEDALFILGGKWKVKIIIALQDSCKRFSEIQRNVPGISAKVLSNELKDLEADGFIIKINPDQTSSIAVYQGTEYINTIKDVMISLRKWGTLHRNKIREQMITVRSQKCCIES